MSDKRRAKDQLIADADLRFDTNPTELAELRQRIAELEAAETERRQAPEALQESRNRLERSNQALAARVAALEALHRIGAAMSSRLETDELLQFIVEQAAALVDAVTCSILLPDEATGELVFHASLDDVVGMRIPADHGIAARALHERASQVVYDVSADPNHYARIGRESRVLPRSLLAVPLLIGDKAVGVLEVVNKRQGRFTEQNCDLLATMASHAAITIENTRLYERAQQEIARRKRAEEALKELASTLEERVRQRTFDLRVLHEISQEIGHVRDFDELVRLMLETLHRTMPLDLSAAILVTGGSYEFFVSSIRPLAPTLQGEIQERLISTFGQLSGKEVSREQGQLSSQGLEPEEFDAAGPPIVHLDSSFQVPLIAGREGGVVGLLFVGAEREEAFTEHQVRLLYTMANQASLFLSIRRSEAALQHRVEIAKFTADVSTLFVYQIPGDLDTGMDVALRSIGQFAAVDRSYVFMFSDDGKMDNTHEWCAEGIASQVKGRRALPVERFPWWMGRLNRFQVVHVPRVADLPPEARAEREFFESQAVQSFVAVPMVYNRCLVGFVAFDSVRAEKSWAEAIISLLRIVAGIIVNALERKRAQERIEASLQEKEVLLQEIHHRVKNNLQVISSLLGLQSGYVKDERTVQMFKESRSRVRSMALIHEGLYRAQDLARVDFAEYIQSLTESLFRSYKIRSAAVTLEVNVEDVYLGVDAAIPCGLIINELVSNALKYAFPADADRPDDGKDEICVELCSEDDGLALVVRDNGVGFPPDVDLSKTKSLGLRLVTTLVRQLKGTIELRSNGGTEFKIKLSALERTGRT